MLEGYARVRYPKLGGLITSVKATDVPGGAASVCEDCEFTPETVKTRQGLTKVFELPSNQSIKGLGVYIRQGASDTQIPILHGSAGTLYKENPIGTGQIEQIATALGADLYADITSAYNKAYFAFSNLVAANGTQYPRQYFFYGTRYFFERLGITANATPFTNGTSSPTAGDVPTGTRYAVVLFQTQSGYISGMTSAAVVEVTITDSGKQVFIEGIPTGPVNTVKRIIAFTEAGLSSAGPFFYIDADDSIQGLNADITATIIEDNETTEATFNFTDQVLRASTEVTSFFDKLLVPPVTGVRFLKSLKRVAYWGNADEPSTVFISEVDDPETLFNTQSRVNVAENDGQRVQNVFEFRSEVIAAKERGGHVITPNNGSPATWDAPERWTGVGPSGPQALDVCEEFVIFAHRSGAYKYDGGNPEWISWEHSGTDGLWARINWKYGHLIRVTIDTETKRVFFSVPLDQSTVPNKVLVLDYRLGFATPIVEGDNGELRGAAGRRWSIYNIPCNRIIRAERVLPADPNAASPDSNILSTSQLLLGSSDSDGAVNMFDPTSNFDNGNMIKSIYQPAYIDPGGVIQLGGYDLKLRGNGELGVTQMSDEDELAERPAIAIKNGKQKLYTSKTKGQADMWTLRLHSRNPGDWWELSEMALWVNQIWGWAK